jgi:DNA-binding NtrC family response regulator
MTRKILVVDDDPGMVRTLCDIFRLRGWEAVGVYSGEEAVAEQFEHCYSHVLMDIMMPGIDGVTALKRMKLHRPACQVILMTAHTADERIAEARREGAMEVVTKPIDLPSLMRLLWPANGGSSTTH